MVHFEGFSRSDLEGPGLDFHEISVWGPEICSCGATDIPKTTQEISLHHSLRVWAALRSKNSNFIFWTPVHFGNGHLCKMDGLNNPDPH